MPYRIATDAGFEGTLQKIYDRELSRKPMLLVCVGSDLAIMEALNEYGRPFHQRATELAIPPLSLADAAEMLGLPAADAFDACLVSGGLPLISTNGRRARPPWTTWPLVLILSLPSYFRRGRPGEQA